MSPQNPPPPAASGTLPPPPQSALYGPPYMHYFDPRLYDPRLYMVPQVYPPMPPYAPPPQGSFIPQTVYQHSLLPQPVPHVQNTTLTPIPDADNSHKPPSNPPPAVDESDRFGAIFSDTVLAISI